MFDKTQTVTLDIEGMMCKHCAAHVGDALKSCKGVRKYAVDLDAKSASVTFVPATVSADQIAAAVTAAGYPAKVRQ